MGFGILFIGYFLFLNIAAPGYTDAVGAVLMLWGLYKLSGINRELRLACYAAMVLTLFGLSELGYEIYDMMVAVVNGDTVRSWFAIFRHFILCITTVLTLLGMQRVSCEVKLARLGAKCGIAARATVAVYILNIVLELSALGSFIDARVLAVLGVTALLIRFGTVIFNLTSIYECYMRICMPGERELTERESRFGFINAARRYQEEKQREYAEYRLGKLKEKQGKSKNDNKHKKRG